MGNIRVEVRSTERGKGKEKAFSQETEFQKVKEELERAKPPKRRRVAEAEPTLNAMQQLNRLHNLGRKVALGELRHGDERRSKARADRPSARPPSPPNPVIEEPFEDMLPEHTRISEEFPFTEMGIEVDQPAGPPESIVFEAEEQQRVQPPVAEPERSTPMVPPPTLPPQPSEVLKTTFIKEALPKQSLEQMPVAASTSSSTKFSIETWKDTMQDYLCHVSDAYEDRLKEKNLAEQELQGLKVEFATLQSTSQIQERALKELHVAYQQVSAEADDLKFKFTELHAKADQATSERQKMEQERESLKLAHQLALDGMTHAQAQIQRLLAAPLSPQQAVIPSSAEVKTLKAENDDLKRQIEELQRQLKAKEVTPQVSIALAVEEPAMSHKIQDTPAAVAVELRFAQAEFSPAETEFIHDTDSFQQEEQVLPQQQPPQSLVERLRLSIEQEADSRKKEDLLWELKII